MKDFAVYEELVQIMKGLHAAGTITSKQNRFFNDHFGKDYQDPKVRAKSEAMIREFYNGVIVPPPQENIVKQFLGKIWKRTAVITPPPETGIDATKFALEYQSTFDSLQPTEKQWKTYWNLKKLHRCLDEMRQL